MSTTEPPREDPIYRPSGNSINVPTVEQAKYKEWSSLQKVFGQYLLVGTFIANLSASLLSYSNNIASRRPDGSNQVNHTSKTCWLLTIWLNTVLVLLILLRAILPFLAMRKGADRAWGGDRQAYYSRFVTFVWKEQNRELGISMVVILASVLVVWVYGITRINYSAKQLPVYGRSSIALAGSRSSEIEKKLPPSSSWSVRSQGDMVFGQELPDQGEQDGILSFLKRRNLKNKTHQPRAAIASPKAHMKPI
ncbi:hypothetical protein BDV93DRAFT_515364 [Ceratobasidium sp. AG-I]|nr:hypothetical protein BDV93DRAFT_515364 [Ceratobasidium sp. AG-I]